MSIIQRIKEYRYRKECKVNQKLFNAGHDARMKGLEKNNNPYLKGTKSYAYWDLGWRIADNIFAEEK